MKSVLLVLALHGSLGLAWYETGARDAPRLRELRPQAVAVVGRKLAPRLALRVVANRDVAYGSRGWYTSAGLYLDF